MSRLFRTKAQPQPTTPEFGLIAWLEKTRIALPLKGVEAHFTVTGGVASVELDQIYHVSTSQAIDCTYTFPLPAGAAVHRCEFHINGRVIRAQVEAEEDARQTYRRKKAAGHRAALVEQVRENLFTLTLGNVQPGDLVVVRIAWFQILDRQAGQFRLHIPTCPGVRYIPGQPLLRAPLGKGTSDDTDQVPDASRLTPPRIDQLHPDAAYFSLGGHVSNFDATPDTISSPSHAVCLREREGTSPIEVKLSSSGSVPDRDFVLTWREPAADRLTSRGWLTTYGDESYALVQFRPPQHVPTAHHLAQDFYFLIDRSGSMQGEKWECTCQALHAFVRLLGPEDRVWITLFESSFQDFDATPMPAPEVLADRGFLQMARMGTGGGTELLPAANHVLQKIQQHSRERRTSVILITDGQVGNEDTILETFGHTPSLIVHTFGIDTAVNDAFLRDLARQHRGGCWLQTPDDDVVGTISGLGDRLRRPVLTDLQVRPPWQCATAAIRDLHAGELATLPLRGVSGDAVHLAAQLPDGSPFTATIELTSGSEAIRLLWARERIEALLSTDSAAAIALAKMHNLICRGTAFVAWDEEAKVVIAKEEIIQPSMFVAESRCLPALAIRACMAPPPSSYGLGADPDILGDLHLCDETGTRLFARGQAPSIEDRARALKLPEPIVEAIQTWVLQVSSGGEDRAAIVDELLDGITGIRHAQFPAAFREAFEKTLVDMVITASSEAASLSERLDMLIITAPQIWEQLQQEFSPKDAARILNTTIQGDRVSESSLLTLQGHLESLTTGSFSARSRDTTRQQILSRK